ncbi:MAG: CHAT domain-containing protein [Pseudorhodoplanes sp.]
MTYSVSWQAGPSAQIELFSPDVSDTGSGGSYHFKFSPPMRKTLRPPLAELILGDGELEPINQELTRLIGFADGRGPPPAGAGEEADIVERTRRIGNILHNLVIPPDVQAELSAPELFVEFGLDERLLEYPWELLYDGQHFLGCRHAMGRFVNVTKPSIPNSVRPQLPDNGPLSVLLISVPNPMPRPGTPPVIYSALSGAQAETAMIAQVLTVPDVELTILAGVQASWNNVLNEINGPKRFHIVHYNGHAYFDRTNPKKSSLVLHDKDMSTSFIQGLLSRKPPLFFFVNACETAMANAERPWKDRYDIFGLARAFLDTGAYLLGTRWTVGDGMAARFAEVFYGGMLKGTPLGSAIRDARCACFDAAMQSNRDDFSWASYSYYGDPRLVFRKGPTH